VSHVGNAPAHGGVTLGRVLREKHHVPDGGAKGVRQSLVSGQKCQDYQGCFCHVVVSFLSAINIRLGDQTVKKIVNMDNC
jgi:hypothetical protein